MNDGDKAKFVVVGGGLGGALAACYLGQAGYPTELYEMRGDPRTEAIPAGRSINLALTHRGISALEGVGLAKKVLELAVPMRGRMMHATQGSCTFQPYGTKVEQVNYSVSRAGLNLTLIEAAAHHDNVELFFNHKCTHLDLDSGAITFDNAHKHDHKVTGSIVVGADGAFSAVRRQMLRTDRFNYSQDYLAHGFKELTIPPGADGSFQLEKNALHIWPRRSFMMIALPNADGSFTCTLFWPLKGPKSFDELRTPDEVSRFFSQHFPDAVALLPTLAEDYFANPTGTLATIRCSPWSVGGRVVLLGDACHAIVPFLGQGMNAAFEDMLVLDECMKRDAPNWERVFTTYHDIRKESVDTLADLSINNFEEMRDRTGSPAFLLKKKFGRILHRLFPWYVPLYTMITYTRMSYVDIVRKARRQDNVVRLLAGLLIVLIILAIWLV